MLYNGYKVNYFDKKCYVVQPSSSNLLLRTFRVIFTDVNIQTMKKIFLPLLLLLIPLVCFSKVVPNNLIGDNMVLQRNTEVRLWGTAAPGRQVRVTPSWTSAVFSATADRNGRFLVKVTTPDASMTPYSITFNDGEGAVRVDNVLIGEVWIAGGQSNMEMPVRGFDNCPVEDYAEVVADAGWDGAIRYAKIPSIMSMEPVENAETRWIVTSPETVMWQSATAYFFARMLSRTLGIPVGIIEANKGGSRVESWLTKENLEKYTTMKLDEKSIMVDWTEEWSRPLVWGNGTFNPVLNYTVAGIIFYQGCSNVGAPGDEYSRLLEILVRQWREQIGLGDIPFYYVEIAPYAYNTVDGTGGAYLREQQFKAAALIPDSGMVCTNDCVYPYETGQIHPAQKRKVGERLAAMALNRHYGKKYFEADYPTFKEMKIESGQISITFDHMTGGVNRLSGIEGFEVAGEDRVFHKASASYKPYTNNQVIVTCPEVEKPVAVRYCFRDFLMGNLKNAVGLPVIPFRTDDW